MPFLQRKYVDLILHVSSKWVNWDPPILVEVGAYGEVESDTGDLRVDGNIYDPEFQEELDKLNIKLRIADHQPQDGSIEDDFVIATKGAKRVELHLAPEIGITGVANASFKSQWQFEQGKRDALLIMRRPRPRYLPSKIPINALYKVPLLKNKWIVTTVHSCPAWSMYLSNKTGETISLALVAQVPIAGVAGATAGGDAGFTWHTDAQADLVRKACDEAGKYCYTPLYTLKCKTSLLKKIFRGEDDENDQNLSNDENHNKWPDALPPWDPLDEDGEEDPVSVGGSDPDDF